MVQYNDRSVCFVLPRPAKHKSSGWKQSRPYLLVFKWINVFYFERWGKGGSRRKWKLSSVTETLGWTWHLCSKTTSNGGEFMFFAYQLLGELLISCKLSTAQAMFDFSERPGSGHLLGCSGFELPIVFSAFIVPCLVVFSSMKANLSGGKNLPYLVPTSFPPRIELCLLLLCRSKVLRSLRKEAEVH